MPDDEFSQDTFSLSPTFHGQNGFNDLSHWAFNDPVLLSSDMSTTSEATEESFDTRSIQAGDYEISDTHMLPFSSCSPPLFPKTDGTMDQSLSELGHMPALSDHQDSSPQLLFSNPQGFQNFTTLSFSYEDEMMHHNAGMSDGKSTGLNMASQPLIKSEAFRQVAWESMSGDMNPASNMTLSATPLHLNRLPMTPPLTEANQDLSSASACPQSYSFSHQAESPFVDFSDTSSISAHTFSIGEPFYPLTPPLTEQDPNR